MDPKEEQATELEALEAIFASEYHLLESPSESLGARFEIDVEDDISHSVKLKMSFTHTKKYPEEPIIVVAHPLQGLTTPNRKKLQLFLEGKAEENADLAMPCAFTLCEEAKDWLRDNVVGQPVVDEEHEREMAKKFETFDASLEEKVEVIQSKAVGTPVTVESFSVWQAEFLVEMEAKRSARVASEPNLKMTGRQQFESKIILSAESESFWEAEANELAGA